MARLIWDERPTSSKAPRWQRPLLAGTLAGLLVACSVSGRVAAAAAASPARIEPSVGLGAILIFPFGHVELRYRPTLATSIAAFASVLPFGTSESEPSLSVANVGLEGRYHFRPESSFDPHVGAGAGVLIGASGRSAQSIPWIWANAGVTFTLAPRLRFDLEVSPVVALKGELPGTRLPVLPFVRLRWLF